MSEAYAVAAQLTMRSNVPEVISQMVQGFERANRLIKETQDALSRLNGRGINNLVAGLEKLSAVKLNGSLVSDLRAAAGYSREMEAAQSAAARSAAEAARAYRSMGGAARSGRSPSAPSAGLHGAGDDYANARAMNANLDQVARAAGAAAAKRFNDDYALGMRENADRDSAARAAGAAANRQTQAAARATSHMHTSAMDVGIGLQMGGDAGMGFFERSISAELEVAKLLTSFRQNNTIGESDIAAIRTKAEALTRQIPGTTIADNLHAMVDAFTVTGSLAEAMAGSEAVSRLNLLFKSLPGARGRDPGFAAAQATEVMQRFYDPRTHEVDIGTLNQQMNAMAQVAAGTGGRVSPSDYLAYAKQARLGGMVANDQFLYRDLPGMLISLGGSRTGTGEAATFQQFVTGTMTKNAAAALQAAGLLDKSAVWKGGRVQDMGHHFRNLDQYAANPIEYIRNNILGPNGVLAQNHIDQNDRLAVSKFLAQWNSRQTGLGFISEPTIGMAGINKEAGKVGSTNADPLSVIQRFDPNAQIRTFQAAENELMVSIGKLATGPALEGLKAITGALNTFSDWAKTNPWLAGKLITTGLAMSIFAQAAGNLALAIYVGAPIVTGMKALAVAAGEFAAGGAAAAGLSGVASGLGTLASVIARFAGGPAAFLLGMKPSDTQTQAAENAGLRNGLRPDAFNHVILPPRVGITPAIPHIGPTFGPQRMPDPSSAPMHLESYRPGDIHIYLDGKEISSQVAKRVTASLSGPNTGTTGFDIRTMHAGLMAT